MHHVQNLSDIALYSFECKLHLSQQLLCTVMINLQNLELMHAASGELAQVAEGQRS